MPKWAKKLGLGLGILFGVLLLAIIVLPLVVDVDSYRPEIVKVANENINGKLELGKLKLSLWFQIKVQVDGFKVTDAKGATVVSATDVFFHLPFAPLLIGSPVVTFKMKRPEIHLVKDKAGKLNVMSLVKAKPTEAKAERPAAGGSSSLPGIVSRASLGIEMNEAQLSYRDEATRLVSEVKDLNVRVRSISLTKPSDFEVWASLDTRMGKTLSVKGPAKISGTFVPQFDGSQFKSGTLTPTADLDGVAMVMPGLLDKKAGMATLARLI